MSVDGWDSVLVLGGIRSGKSEFAESLVRDAAAVRYIVTASDAPEDAEWRARVEAHHRRRPQSWITEEMGADPSRLAEVISTAGSGETLIVDDLGGWVTVLLDPVHQPADDLATINELAGAVRECAARLVLVSPEVGLSLVPVTPVGRAFADALGSANQAVAQACDAVVLVVAGQPTWLKRTGWPEPAAQVVPQTTAMAAGTAPAPGVTPIVIPTDSAAPAMPTGVVFQSGMDLAMPDEHAGPQALDRLAGLDVRGAGLGNLERVIAFAAATQGTAAPVPWDAVHVLLLRGDHAGGSSAGVPEGDSKRRAAQAAAGEGPLAQLIADAGASLQVVDAPTAAPIEDGPALSAEAVESALAYGWRLAEDAVDRGVAAIVLAACGNGTETAATAVLAATAGAEPAAVLGRVIGPGRRVDDAAWMTRCAAVRDALRRGRRGPRGAKNVLAELGGGDIAIATGVLLGACARRTPVLLDGPVGVAAGLVSRDLAGQARHWCLLPDHGGQPAVRLAADVLGLAPLLDLRLDLGEGATALVALPTLRSALSLARVLERDAPPVEDAEPTAAETTGDAATPGEPDGPTPGPHDEPAANPASQDDATEFVEPEPAGPGPAAPKAVTDGDSAREPGAAVGGATTTAHGG
jgi:nicotinate-nucleotide--dimethylbenzimidazole phosphoribosyltransferase